MAGTVAATNEFLNRLIQFNSRKTTPSTSKSIIKRKGNMLDGCSTSVNDSIVISPRKRSYHVSVVFDHLTSLFEKERKTTVPKAT
jgi:hypothetical protein